MALLKLESVFLCACYSRSCYALQLALLERCVGTFLLRCTVHLRVLAPASARTVGYGKTWLPSFAVTYTVTALCTGSRELLRVSVRRRLARFTETCSSLAACTARCSCGLGGVLPGGGPTALVNSLVRPGRPAGCPTSPKES